MSAGVLYWLRQDLRLHDNPALLRAAQHAREQGGWLLPVHVQDPIRQAATRWGFVRMGRHRQVFEAQALRDLEQQLTDLGSSLLRLRGSPAASLIALAQRLGVTRLVCEEIPAPEEQAQVQALRDAGLAVETVWQSTLFDPADLPCAPEAVPDTFTTLRQALERAQVREAAPLAAPDALPPGPASRDLSAAPLEPADLSAPADPRTAFPYADAAWQGGERTALQHLARYCALGLPHTYKQTRNGLTGLDCSSKFSCWLASGALSPRQVMAAIRAFEVERGANEGSYWLWFELLWRDHFRWMHCKHGHRLYGARGLSDQPLPAHNAHGGRRFDTRRQAEIYDHDGAYRRLWGVA